MAKNKPKEPAVFTRNPGLFLAVIYTLIFAVNAVVLALAHFFFPENIVLGTISIGPVWAVIHSMGMLALLNTFTIPVVREYEYAVGRMFTNQEWMLLYFLLNFAGIWLIARFADQVGMGITSWSVAVFLAVVLDIVQGAVMMQLENIRKTSV